MTREEAIRRLLNIERCTPIHTREDIRDFEALEMAIKALEQEPCGDLISRQIISDYVESHIQEINTGYGDLNKHTNEILRMIVDYIESMPPVNPQESKTGRWIEHMNNGIAYIECSKCKTWFLREHLVRNSFCPDCGCNNFTMIGDKE